MVVVEVVEVDVDSNVSLNPRLNILVKSSAWLLGYIQKVMV